MTEPLQTLAGSEQLFDEIAQLKQTVALKSDETFRVNRKVLVHLILAHDVLKAAVEEGRLGVPSE